MVVVGQTPCAIAGEFFEADGVWQDDPEHGLQFKAETLQTTPPSTVEGIEKSLVPGSSRGSGRTLRRIVQVFGPRTLQVIDESPSFLKEVKGLGSRRIERIRESWKQQRAVRDIMVFMQSHGIGTSLALRIYKIDGERAVPDKVREDPDRRHRRSGIGFQTADELARRLGLDPQSVKRGRAAPALCAARSKRRGHTALPEAAALERAGRLTGIEADVLSAAAGELIAHGDAVRESELTPLQLLPICDRSIGPKRVWPSD